MTPQSSQQPEQLGRAWGQRRPAFDGVHLDSAAAGRQSNAVLEASAAHARAEAQHGAYVAESAAQAVIAGARAGIGALIGMPAESVAFVQSASDALRAVLELWPLRAGEAIGVLPDEWGPNLQAFARRGLRIVELPTTPDGHADVAGVAAALRSTRLAAVHVVHLNPHRPIVQPAAELAATCTAEGVPLWVDAAQSLGHVDTAVGADAIYAPGRKWLAGPRGAAVLGIAARHWDGLHSEPPVLHPETPFMQRLENDDASIAARIGLAQAVRELHADDPVRVCRHLVEVGERTRDILAGLDGWALGTTAGALTVLHPMRGQDVRAARMTLLGEHRVLTTASPPERAPRLTPQRAALRISPHADCTDADLERLRTVLRTV